MPAFQNAVCHYRKISDNRNVKLLLNHLFQTRVEHTAYPVQDDASDTGLLLKIQKALNHGENRPAGSLCRNQQKNRGVCDRSQVAGSCSGGIHGQSVIVPHDALHHGSITVCGVLFQKISCHGFPCKKGIQISAPGSQYPGVDHRVNKIRSALKVCRPDIFPGKQPQQTAGQQGLSASACRSGYHQTVNFHD